MTAMKVAVIEDHLPVRQLLVRRAEKLDGLRVVAQASGEDEAVDAVLATVPDVVLLDLRLAQGTGLSVLNRLRGQAYAGHVFVLSGEDAATHAAACRRQGADAFYDKAFDFEQLLSDLHDLCKRAAANGPLHPIRHGQRAVANG